MDVEVEGLYALRQFQELCRLHKMSILIHSRFNFSRELAKKLRPEVNKLLLTTDIRICMKLIAKRNADVTGAGGIDLVIVDYDSSTLRLLDYINKRPMMEETAKHPLIPTITLVYEGSEMSNAKENIDSVGGSNAIMQLPLRTRAILLEMIDILHRRRQLDATFRDLKQKTVQYPFLGVFTVSKDEIDREAKEASSMQGSVVLSEEKDAIFDDWMDCDSILPADLMQIRNIERERRDPADYRDIRFSNPVDRLHHEISERHIIDHKLAKTAHLALAELHGHNAVVGAEIDANFDPSLDAEDFSLDNPQEHHDHAHENNTNKGVKPASHAAFIKSTSHLDSCDVLLDPARRPKWYQTVKSIDGSSSKDVLVSDLEIRPFIDKTAPNILIPKTANGLDKTFVENCWASIKGQSNTIGKSAALSKSSIHSRLSSNLNSPTESPLPSSRIASTHPGTPNGRSAKDNSNSTANKSRPTSSSKGISKRDEVPIAGISLSQRSPVSTGRDSSQKHNKKPGDLAAVVIPGVGGGSRRSSVNNQTANITGGQTGLSANRLSTLMAVAMANDDARKEIKAEKDASRQLAKLTKGTAHDLHFGLLGDMDSLLHRQLNQGERDLLVEGIRIEGEEDLDRAHIYYTRAGMHSHEQHLSKIFLGCLFYKKKNYLNAIKYFSSAITLLEELRGHSENYEVDSFRAHYNRAVTKINCGDDEEGIKDLETAVSLRSDNILARETLAIALRRIGKFEASIVHTLKVKDIQTALANEARNNAFLDEAAHSIVQGHSAAAGKDEGDAHHLQLVHQSSQHPQQQQKVELMASISEVEEGNEGLLSQLHPHNSSSNSLLGNNHQSSASAPPPGLMKRESSHKFAHLIAKENLHKTREQLAEELENRAIAARTTYVTVTDSRGSMGFKERKEVALKRALGHGDEGESTASRLSLVAFKMKNGFKPDLFEHLFFKPSNLQEALAHAPGQRTQDHVEIIASTLRLVPLFVKLKDSQISELAAIIEYRPITSKSALYSQDAPATGVSVLLKGEVEIKIESAEHATRNLVVGHLKPFDAFGYIDILFLNHDPSLWRQIVDMLRLDLSNPLVHGLTLGGDAAGEHGDGAPGTGVGLALGDSLEMLSDLLAGSASSVIAGASNGPTGAHSPQHQYQHAHAPHQHQHAHQLRRSSTGNGNSNGSVGSNDGSSASSVNQINHSSHNNNSTSATLDALNGHHANRARAAGVFATYTMTTLCELMIINAKDFYRILYPTVVEEFLKRLQVLQVCGVFGGLHWLDLVRLARMSQVMTFNSGDIILKQGSKPKYIYFVIDGLCQVWAQANNAEIFERQLNELQERARRHDLKYTYHHKLRTAYTRADLPQVKNHKQITALQQLQAQRTMSSTTGTCSVAGSMGAAAGTTSNFGDTATPTITETADVYMNLQWETNITCAEIMRQELGLEIEQTKVKLARARAVEQATANMTKNESHTTWTAADCASQCEVKTLRWPMLFGEACVLDPDTGTSRGTVVAGTCCHILAVHKTQIQTFHVNDDLLMNVRLRSVEYPDDKTIEQSLSRGKKWMEFRGKEMSRIRKTRWPKLNSDVEPFIL